MAERDYSIDALSGLMILGVVFVHVMSWSGLENALLYTIVEYLIFYRMPYFFYKSGMFYKATSDRKAIIGGGKLLWLFVKFSLIAHIVNCIFLAINDNLTFVTAIKQPFKTILTQGTIGSNLPLWFLTTFFCAKVIFNFFCSRNCKSWIIAFVTGIIGVLSFNMNEMALLSINLPLYFYSINIAIFFMACGATFRNFHGRIDVLLVSTILYVICAILCHSRVDVFENELLEGNYVIWMLSSIAGIIVITRFFKILYKKYKFPILTFINNNALELFASHWIIYLIVYNSIVKTHNINNPYLLASVYTISIILYLLAVGIYNRQKHVTNR